ncbi:unnamed protein product, partial [Amoebophrya sp. A120]
ERFYPQKAHLAKISALLKEMNINYRAPDGATPVFSALRSLINLGSGNFFIPRDFGITGEIGLEGIVKLVLSNAVWTLAQNRHPPAKKEGKCNDFLATLDQNEKTIGKCYVSDLHALLEHELPQIWDTARKKILDYYSEGRRFMTTTTKTSRRDVGNVENFYNSSTKCSKSSSPEQQTTEADWMMDKSILLVDHTSTPMDIDIEAAGGSSSSTLLKSGSHN